MYINKGKTFLLSEQYETGGVLMVADADINLAEAVKEIRYSLHQGGDESLADWLEERKFAHRVEFEWFVVKG